MCVCSCKYLGTLNRRTVTAFALGKPRVVQHLNLKIKRELHTICLWLAPRSRDTHTNLCLCHKLPPVFLSLRLSLSPVSLSQLCLPFFRLGYLANMRPGRRDICWSDIVFVFVVLDTVNLTQNCPFHFPPSLLLPLWVCVCVSECGCVRAFFLLITLRLLLAGSWHAPNAKGCWFGVCLAG